MSRRLADLPAVTPISVLALSATGPNAPRVEELLRNPELRARLGETGRERSLANFGVERLVADIDGLHRRLLDESGPVA